MTACDNAWTRSTMLWCDNYNSSASADSTAGAGAVGYDFRISACSLYIHNRVCHYCFTRENLGLLLLCLGLLDPPQRALPN